MALFQVTNHVSGSVVDVVECENAAGALDAVARLAGYASHAALSEVAPSKPGELVVTPAYVVTVADANGEPTELTGDLPTLRQALSAAGYNGPSIRVLADNGETRGWVNAETWRAA